MSFPDWGSVPAWLGTGSLLLAYRVFNRDRANADRAQVDRVGVWGTTTYERKAPDDKDRVESGEIRLYVRNASDLPVEVRQLAYEVHTKWLVPDWGQCADRGQPDVWLVEVGTRPDKAFLERIRVPPQETWEQSFPINFAHLAPEGASQPEWFHGVACEISWILVTDNAGRRWESRQSTGRRARRIRRCRRREYQPARW